VWNERKIDSRVCSLEEREKNLSVECGCDGCSLCCLMFIDIHRRTRWVNIPLDTVLWALGVIRCRRGPDSTTRCKSFLGYFPVLVLVLVLVLILVCSCQAPPRRRTHSECPVVVSRVECSLELLWWWCQCYYWSRAGIRRRLVRREKKHDSLVTVSSANTAVVVEEPVWSGHEGREHVVNILILQKTQPFSAIAVISSSI